MRPIHGMRRVRDPQRVTRSKLPLRLKLCLRRQPASQTVPLTTAIHPDCASGDNQRRKCGSGCRRMHSLSCRLSSDAQSAADAVAACVVCSVAMQGVRMVFRSLGWMVARFHPSKSNTVLKSGARSRSPSQRTEYHSHSAGEGSVAIPANEIPFSLGIATEHAAITVTASAGNCASGDSVPVKLCI